MAWESLADFFAVGHNCNDWTLQKAVMRCATGRYRESLCKAGYDWHPQSYKYKTLKRIMIAAGEYVPNSIVPMPAPLTRGQITPDVTRVRRELEAWLRTHYPLSPKAPPPTTDPPQSKEWLKVEQENKQRFQAWLAKVKQENPHNG